MRMAFPRGLEVTLAVGCRAGAGHAQGKCPGWPVIHMRPALDLDGVPGVVALLHVAACPLPGKSPCKMGSSGPTSSHTMDVS